MMDPTAEIDHLTCWYCFTFWATAGEKAIVKK